MKRAAAAILAGALVFAQAAASSAEWSGVPVLMYHKVNADVPRDPVGHDLTITPEVFSAQLRWLRAHRIRTMTAAALIASLRRGEHPQRSVVLTFDDGYADAATIALPLLRANGAVGTFYISSGFIGTPRHLTWQQIRELQQAGMEIACHGTFHLDLSTLDRAGQLHEAKHCVDAFARYLKGFRPATYAYPAGKYDAVTFSILKELRFEAAFTEHPGVVRSLDAPYAMPRRRISHADGLDVFGGLATP